ncbi:Pisatin demethylase [Madurella mycetomatis]|uniref:Pisatin demethylase n=1 Tax=Madurella mycetomatis TaxID=100816 RepID=A0A175VPN8_9PEZI|nr:Pisatin demethylase [Madurella mycetomatis]KXX73353.1 Pisatin demethylase [Madurella mycetomatis]
MASSGSIVDSPIELHGFLVLDSHALSRLVAFIVVPIVTLFAWFTISWAASPLRKFPGPFLAGYTNLWRLAQVLAGDYQKTIKKLHEQYGPVVRIGPNTLDIDYPELIRTIYSTDGRWHKTEFYHNNSAIVNGRITYHIFSTTDQVEHARMKRPVVKYFSQGACLDLEPHMDGVISDFIKHLDQRFASPGSLKACNLGEWVAYYAWDLISSTTFSRRFGYMEAGRDFDQTIAIADKALDYFSAVGQIPWLDFLLDKNPVMRIGPPNLSNVTRIALESLVARTQGKDANFNPAVPDYLAHFLESKTTHPDLVNDGTVMGYLLVNLLAGADTTAITIRAIFYFCLKNPSTYERLVREVRAAGFDADKPVAYTAAHKLAYLDAVVKEAMRLHPAVSMLLERYVPQGGLTLPDGSYVPAGTAVGLNAYVTGRNKGLYGEDAEEFKPERWLKGDGETEERYKARLVKMQQADLTFGAGSRVCLGRHLALMEVYKIVATLVNRYDIELDDPAKEWTVTCSWFARQEGLVTKMSVRT